MASTHSRSMFRVGDRVQIDFGPRKLTGVVVEDRGAIGANGRHLFRVTVPMDPHDPMFLELPEDEMAAVGKEAAPPAPLRNQQVVEYLGNGGLISILRSNLSGGRNQPRVWLCLDNLGNVTHTFIPERGQSGGQIVPFMAVHDDKIFTPKRDEVLAYLQESFDLNPQDAKEVVSGVGTSP